MGLRSMSDIFGLVHNQDRLRIPQYIGLRGRLNLAIQDTANLNEVEELILESYRRFALKRMLKQMDQTHCRPK